MAPASSWCLRGSTRGCRGSHLRSVTSGPLSVPPKQPSWSDCSWEDTAVVNMDRSNMTDTTDPLYATQLGWITSVGSRDSLPMIWFLVIVWASSLFLPICSIPNLEKPQQNLASNLSLSQGTSGQPRSWSWRLCNSCSGHRKWGRSHPPWLGPTMAMKKAAENVEQSARKSQTLHQHLFWLQKIQLMETKKVNLQLRWHQISRNKFFKICCNVSWQ